jgi:hypothetical protein
MIPHFSTSISRAVFALGQRRQQIRIGQHRQRLMKRADQILPARQVRPRLAAHGRVHLRQQRRRNLNHRDAAHEDGCQKPPEIVHHAAAERDHDRTAVSPRRHHLLRHRLNRRQALSLLAPREEDEMEITRAQRRTHPLPVVPPHRLLRHHEDLPGARRNKLPEAAQATSFHNGFIALRRRDDGKGRHTFVVP